MEFNRGAFIRSLAALSAALPGITLASEPPGTPTAAQEASPQRLLGRLMAGNKRFVDNDLPAMSRLEEKRELLLDHQSPFAAILSCADSRVIPNLVFIQGIGDLFVARVAGNYPDDLVIASLEYAIEHLGTRLIMVLGHENCGAVKSVYDAMAARTTLPKHLSTIQDLMAPGMEAVVNRHGSMDEAVEANVRAAVRRLDTTSPYLSAGVASGHLLITGGVYKLRTGKVQLVD
jgi:carbonic anhydrase